MQPANTLSEQPPRHPRGHADMRPCRRCGRTDPHRMFALMTLWFARFADLPLHGGYFYLCPQCYEERIAPHLAPVVESLVARHDDEDEARSADASDDLVDDLVDDRADDAPADMPANR
jgi:hypothetical protein